MSIREIEKTERETIEVSPELEIFIEETTDGNAHLILVFPEMNEVQVRELGIKATGEETVISEDAIAMSSKVIAGEDEPYEKDRVRKQTYGVEVQLNAGTSITVTISKVIKVKILLISAGRRKVSLGILEFSKAETELVG